MITCEHSSHFYHMTDPAQEPFTDSGVALVLVSNPSWGMMHVVCNMGVHTMLSCSFGQGKVLSSASCMSPSSVGPLELCVKLVNRPARAFILKAAEYCCIY